jgi:predicted DCC family thiol-disulfide oxidoreductase YuxK
LKNSKYQNVILFDGLCNLCCQSVQFIIKFDPHKQFRFASLQSEIGKQIIATSSYDSKTPQDLKSIVLIRDGVCIYKSDAALKIAQSLSFPANLLAYFKFFPKILRDWIYDIVASNRYQLFGKKAQCILPDASISNRFLR